MIICVASTHTKGNSNMDANEKERILHEAMIVLSTMRHHIEGNGSCEAAVNKEMQALGFGNWECDGRLDELWDGLDKIHSEVRVRRIFNSGVMDDDKKDRIDRIDRLRAVIGRKASNGT